MTKKLFFFLVIFSIAFSGCKKEALEVHPELEGVWLNGNRLIDASFIEIHPGKNSKIAIYDGRETKIYEGIARVKDDELIIKRTSFHIDAQPFYNEYGNYVMIINGEYYKNAVAPNIGQMYFNIPGQVEIQFAVLSYSSNYFSQNVSSYDLQYKLQSSPTWITINNWTPPFLTGLAAASTYECRLKAHYPWHDSEYGGTATFTTP